VYGNVSFHLNFLFGGKLFVNDPEVNPNMDSDEHVADMKVKDMSERNLEAPIDDLTISETGVLSEEQNKRLRLKADLVVLPIMVIASTLAFLDKVRFLASGVLP
jgi:hypothetical protein